ncbi:MAG TPA: hypothetical protein VK824_12300, partial [Planctomycetota bacterium]|nr:hypothetical protein [Planctomycetota bacterium]
MFTMSSRWLTGAAVIAGLAVAAPAHAQDTRGASPAPTRPAADPATPDASQPEAPPAARREAQAGAQQPVAPARGAAMSREEALKQLATQESAHRTRSAKLARLKELAQAENKA